VHVADRADAILRTSRRERCSDKSRSRASIFRLNAASKQASKPKRSNNVTNVELPLEACFDDPFATTAASRVSEIRASIRERLDDDRGDSFLRRPRRITKDSADEINQLKSAKWSRRFNPEQRKVAPLES